MKKAMIVSGVFSATVLSIGIVLKYLHMNGASICVVLGIGIFSLIFLPLMATLKIKEKQNSRDRLLLVLGSLSAISICLGILFKLQHWPGANQFGLITIGILILLFLPVYFITGIRQPETKVNTIVSTILLVAGCGLFLSLARTPQASYTMKKNLTEHYLRSEQLLKQERLAMQNPGPDATAINALCDQLKSKLIEYETGSSSPDWCTAVLSEDRSAVIYGNVATAELVQELKERVGRYNKQAGITPLPVAIPLFERNDDRTLPVLNDLVQIQLFLMQNEAHKCD